MEVESVFITGANRGIGLELVRQIVKLPKPPKYVFATYRNRDTAMELKEIRESCKECQVFMIKMDVRNKEQIEAARKIVEDMVGDDGLNLLINNAGALKLEDYFPDISEENLLFHFTTNTIGPLSVLREMLPLLQKAASNNKSSGLSVSRAAVLNISSSGGSCFLLDDRQPKEWLSALSYRVSKAALNIAMRGITVQVKDQGILVVNMCPGWVKTEIGMWDLAELEVSESVSDILKTCAMLNETHQGGFINRNGYPIPF